MEIDLEFIAATLGIVLMLILIIFSLRDYKTLTNEQKTKFKKEFSNPLN